MGKQKILIVDDSEINRALLAEILEEQYEITEAEKGSEAISLLSKRRSDFSLLLLDIIMPVMDGFQSAKAIRSLEREDASKVAIIALTASDYEEDAQKCRQAGMDEHLPKPLDAGNLIRVIQKYLR